MEWLRSARVLLIPSSGHFPVEIVRAKIEHRDNLGTVSAKQNKVTMLPSSPSPRINAYNAGSLIACPGAATSIYGYNVTANS